MQPGEEFVNTTQCRAGSIAILFLVELIMKFVIFGFAGLVCVVSLSRMLQHCIHFFVVLLCAVSSRVSPIDFSYSLAGASYLAYSASLLVHFVLGYFLWGYSCAEVNPNLYNLAHGYAIASIVCSSVSAILSMLCSIACSPLFYITIGKYV